MKISEKQLLMLMDIAKDTLKIANVMGGYDLQTRLQLINDLINQQSNDLKEIDHEDA
jgi:hypothetical protein